MMNRKRLFLDFSLLKKNRYFRTIFIARLLSIFSLGMLIVGVPVQVQQMTGSTLLVGVAVAIEGIGTFVGLLCGGVLADRFDRRKLILFARGTCGIGFVLLSLNAFSPTPSLLVLYLLSAWDGFFGALGITALMAVIPKIVGRSNLASAGALSMLTVRLGAIISPALGGVLIVAGGVGLNFSVAALGTLSTLIPLSRLPALPPMIIKPEHPLRAMMSGFVFVVRHPVIGCILLLGLLMSTVGGIRILFPVLAEEYFQVGLSQLGLMYSAIPLGAMIGAFTSGWIIHLYRPGIVLLICACLAFISIILLGILSNYILGLFMLICYGYFNAIAALLQLTLIQTYTPDKLLGRVNSIGTIQDISGDALGALSLGALGRLFLPSFSVSIFGLCALTIGLVISLFFTPLHRCQFLASSIRDDNR